MTGTSSRVLGIAMLVFLPALCTRCEQPSRAAIAAAVPAPSIEDIRLAAGRQLTAGASTRVPAWHIRARAAGHDCGVLLVDIGVNMEDVLVNGLQYGVAPYEIAEGGLHRFSREHSFRAVAYRDAAGRIWTYGAISRTDAESMVPCRNHMAGSEP
ncbi:MAG: hypothetical protein QOH21_1180 [Acidobacteriota bacterium]|jgi:hypothetical protein|nr:hypothetical protein [Acidobacteriota bacterium]